MLSIDERVVAMAFENQVFETRVSQTITTLGKLDTAVKNIGSARGLDEIERAANKVTLQQPMSALDKLRAKLSRAGDGASDGMNEIERSGNKVTLEGPSRALDKLRSKFSRGVTPEAIDSFSEIEKASHKVSLEGIGNAIDKAAGKFSVLSGAASVALGGIASQAAMKGAAFGKSFAFGPINDGLNEYKTNLGSIQTILANTEGQQVSGLDEVKSHLGELNTYSDQTIYNFSEMAKNIGTFTAAGVDMDTATQSIKGIANLAALSGSNSQQASTAMYQLSQAISSGRVGLQDWNSVVNAGMGGAVFQKSLMKTAVAMGKIPEEAVKIDKATGKATVNGESFRNSIMAKPGQESWLTSDVLTTSLKNFTGDMSEADLIAQGFTKTQAAAVMQQAKTAKAAATEVKTLSQAFDVAKETIGSGWAKTFELIFGDFEESKKTFTEFSNTLNGFINNASDARNKVLGEWKKLGGRTVLIEGIKQAFENLMLILKPIKQAFQDIFPPATGKSLFEFTKSFAQLMQNLRPSPALISTIHHVFSALFAVFHTGFAIVKGVAGVIFNLLGVVGHGSGGVMAFARSFSDVIVAIDQALTKGGLLNGFFQTLTNILKAPLTMLGAIGTAIFGMFSGADPEKAKGMGDALSIIGEKVKPMADILDKASGAWDKFKSILSDVGALVSPWFEKIADEVSNFGSIIADAIRNADFDMVFSALNTTFLGGLFLAIKKALGGGLAEQFGGGLLNNIGKSFGALTGNLEAMQKNLQASALLKIAAAIGVLAAGILVLSKIDPKDLSKAMTAITVGLGQLTAVMLIMGKMGGGFTLGAIAAGMVLLSTSILILSGAVKVFATMNWDEIARGLAGVGGSMAAIGIGMKFLGPGTLIQGPALIAIGLALNVIAAAVKQFAGMKWEDLGKGVAGLGASLAILAGAMWLMPPNMAASALGLIGMSIGVTLLAAAVGAMGSLKVDTIAKGIAGIALAMMALAWAISGFPPTLALQAAGLVILSVALSGIAGAVGLMGGLSIWKLAKGLVAMGAALTILAVGLYLMVGSAPGAVALMGAAAAFAVLAPAMALMGNLDWTTILKALATMALTLATLSVVGIVAAIPLVALGAALAVLGLGLLPVTASIYLLAKGLSILGSEGTKGLAVMVAALTAFVALLPKIIIDFVKGLVGIIAAIAQVAPKVVESLGIIIGSALATISLAIPKIEEVLGKLFGAFVRIINAQSGPVIAAGIKLLLNFLTGVSQNIGKVVQKASDIVVNFLNGLTANRARLTAAGLGTMLAFLGGISTGIPRIVAKVAEMVSKFLSAVTSRIPGIITKGAEMIVSIARGIGSNIGKVVAAGTEVIIKFMAGIGKAIPDLVTAGLRLARRFLNGIADGLSGLADVGFKAIIRFLNGIEKSIRDNFDDLWAAGAGIADALIDGLVGQFGKAGGALRSAIEGAMKLLPHWARKVLGIKSPSREFATIGQQTMDGFSVGVNEHRMHADKAVINAAHGAMQSFSKAVISRRTEPAAQFREVGRRSMQGLTQGLNDYRRPVVDAAGGIVNSMIATFKDVLQVRSPSRVMKDIGKNVGEGFAQGLHGSKDDIKSSFKSLRETLADEMRNERDQIKEENKKLRDLQEQQADKLAELRELQKHPRKNAEEIASTQKELKDIRSQIHESEVAISRYSTNLRGATAAHSILTKSLQDEKAKLIGLSKELESTTDNLEEAKGKLDDITKARQQFIDSTTEQYSKLPDEGQLLADALEVASQTAEEAAEKRKKKAEEDEKKRKINQVANYKKALAEQIAATKKYQETLQKLRELGLDDVTYRKLLAKGLEGQEFATQLAASGKGGIDELNKLDSELLSVSTGLAEQSAGNLYNAGVAAAQGLVDGLTARQAELKKAMDVLADSMVARIKYALGIRSPSQVFSEVGKFMMDGLAKGVQDNQNGVDSSIQSMAQNAVDAAKDSFGAIDMGSIMEVEPTITPVLDLSQVEKDAGQLSDLADVTPITAAASFRQAAFISDSQAALMTARDAAPQAAVNHVELTQNNYSPEALSDIEIYRQTNNQLAQVKNALGLGRPQLYSAG